MNKRFVLTAKRTRLITLATMLVCIVASMIFFLFHFGGKNTYTYSPETKILVYHLISDETYGEYEYLFVKEADFEAQLQEIRRLGYETVFADELEYAKGEKIVVITFDDGYADNYRTALPLLKKYNMKATVFLVVGLIVTDGYLTEEQIFEMQESGHFRFGSHTVTHRKLDTLSIGDIEKELSESKTKIKAITGSDVCALAYPNGAYNNMVELLAEKHGYRYCYTTNIPAEPYYENTRLPRSDVVRDMQWEKFIAIFND